MIDPPDTYSHPQGGVLIYPNPNLIQKTQTQKYPDPNTDFDLLLT